MSAKQNAQLHRLHVMWAMQHLVALKKSIKKLTRSNFNWYGPVQSLETERAKLLSNDPAYQEAAWRLLAGQRAIEVGNEGNLVILDRLTDKTIPEPEKSGSTDQSE